MIDDGGAGGGGCEVDDDDDGACRRCVAEGSLRRREGGDVRGLQQTPKINTTNPF